MVGEGLWEEVMLEQRSEIRQVTVQVKGVAGSRESRRKGKVKRLECGRGQRVESP
jgi:hypothetical protein